VDEFKLFLLYSGPVVERQSFQGVKFMDISYVSASKLHWYSLSRSIMR
jgi:hypothetical protein